VAYYNDVIVASPGAQAWSHVELADDFSKAVVTYNDGANNIGYAVLNPSTGALITSGTANTTADVTHGRAQIADDGSFVITYRAGDASTQYFQRFDSSNNPDAVQGEVDVWANTGLACYSESNAAIGMNTTTGEFIIAGILQGGTNNDDVYVMRFNADGTPMDDFDGNPATDDPILCTVDVGRQNMWPGVNVDDQGDFTVTFSERDKSGAGNSHDVVVRRFSRYGGAVDQDTILLNTEHVAGGQAYSDIDLQPDGDCMVGWDSSNNPGDYGAGSYGYYSAWGAGVPGIILGDVQGDDDVDLDDLGVLAGNYAGTAGPYDWWHGDIDNDDDVDLDDLGILAGNYGSNWPPPSSVPEPATLGLLALGGGLALIRRRRS